MNAGKKLAMVYVAGTMLVAGCGQSDSAGADNRSSKPAATQSQSSLPQKSSGDSVDGYKSFKFGMKPTELFKLAECASSNADFEKKLKEYEDSLRESEDKLRLAEHWMKKYKEELEIAEHNYARDTVIAKNAYENHEDMARRHKESIEGIMKQAANLKANKEDYYLNQLQCKVDFAGDEVKPDLFFDDQKRLSSVGIDVGEFNQARLDSLIKKLQEKYPLSSVPSDETLATFNQGRFGFASWFFADNSVELRVSKGTRYTDMSVHYHDAITAKKAFEASQKGTVSSGDL